MNITGCLKALRSAYTYNLGTNAFLRGGFLLGLLVSIFPLVFEGILSRTGGRSPLEEIRAHPFYLIFLAHPPLFGIIFGAIGTIKRDLDRHQERKVTVLSGLAMTDPLTGLYNRRYVEEELMNLLHRAERAGGPVSVVFFDLDHFKGVNEKDGHRGGDLMLKRVAEALQSVLRKGEILGRYGGDEFLLVVAADLPYATNLVERAVTMVKVRTGLSLSAGVARSSDDGMIPEELIAAADARLANVQAKHHLEQSHAPPSAV
jgi:diguanylate cyclase (GGDEF)-like protein